MKAILEVFDPAMCCSTGVCGPDVDPKLVHFAADLDWLKSQDVDVRRYNLAHQPAEFASHLVIKQLLTDSGTQALPVILIDGKLVSQACYPTRAELAALAGIIAPDSPIVSAVSQAAAQLSAITRELIAIGAAIAANSESCFEFHHAKLTNLGVSAADIAAAIRIAQSVKATAAEHIDALAGGENAAALQEVPTPCCGDEITHPVNVLNVRNKAKAKTSCCGG